jgi:hypothetical protein
MGHLHGMVLTICKVALDYLTEEIVEEMLQMVYVNPKIVSLREMTRVITINKICKAD